MKLQMLFASLMFGLLSSTASAFDVGSVWITSATSNASNSTITVDWAVTDPQHPESSPTSYEVCWKEAGKLAGTCNTNSITTSTHPCTIPNLKCDEKYKVRVRALTYHKKNNGKLKNLEMRDVNEVKVSTPQCISPSTASGTIYATSSTDSTITVNIDYSLPGILDFVRIGYRKRSNLSNLHHAVSYRPFDIATWQPSSSKRGLLEIYGVPSSTTVTFGGLEPCTEYQILAYGFLTGGGDYGVKIGKTDTRTTGSCKHGGLFMSEYLLNQGADIAESYLSHANGLYTGSFTPSTHTIGVMPVGARLLAIDKVAGSTNFTLQTLDASDTTSMHVVATTNRTGAPSSAIRAGVTQDGGALEFVWMEDMWEVYASINALAPVRTGVVNSAALAYDCVARNGRAYFACGNTGIAVVDATNPANPVISNFVNGIGDVRDLSLVGTTLYAAAPDIGVIAFDVSNATNPVLLNLYLPGYVNSASALTADAAHIYVVNSAGLEVLDASTLALVGTKAAAINAVQMESGSNSFWLLGTMQDGVEFYSGFLTFDVSNPAAPFLAGSVDPCNSAFGCVLKGFTMQGGRAYVALGGGGVTIVDPSNLAQPYTAGSWAPGSSPLHEHLASISATFAAAKTAMEADGDECLFDGDDWGWIVEQQRATFDLWQTDPSLSINGDDLFGWVTAQYPNESTTLNDLADPVGQEGFNIDLGAGAGIPDASYYGAATRSGTWNQITAPWSATLLDTSGRPSSATATCNAGAPIQFASPLTSEGEAAIYDDGQSWTNPMEIIWIFANLAPGQYVVTTNAWNPDNSGATVEIEVDGSPDGIKTCGGTWPGFHSEGVTFVKHTVAAPTGSITLRARVLSGTGVLNGIQLEHLPPPGSGTIGVDYCFGDGTGTACPCANSSSVGADVGCLNSLGLGGKLLVTGNTSLSADSVVLTGTQMPNSSALYFQGTARQSSGNGAVFGDGLRCAAGTILRLATKSNVGGTSSYPTAGNPSVSVKGLISSPGTRTYQVWYRNAAAFCTASTYNLSQGVELSWGP